MKMLVIGAHPADPFDLAGGTMAAHVENGDEVTVLCVTDGLNSHTLLEDYGIVEKRREVNAAADYLGLLINPRLTVDFMGYGDEPLLVNQSCVAELVDRLVAFRPDVVVTHHPNEYSHWDHAATGQMVCRALKGAIKNRKAKHWVDDVYFFGVQFRPETARLGHLPLPPTVLVDIEGFMARKVKAMCCFKSQGLDDEAAMWARMASMESETGRADGLGFSEGFISYYPFKEKLLPTSGLKRSFYVKKKDD